MAYDPGGITMMERRRENRRPFNYYLKVVEEGTLKLIGHMTDINKMGFKVDSPLTLAVGTDIKLRIDLTSEISTKSYMSFTARVKWCKQDEFTPNMANIGFEVSRLSPEDAKIYEQIIQKYSGR